ncbi:AbrB family transcriptional regulator [Nocardia thraciensis]
MLGVLMGALLGPLLITAALTAVGVSHGYAPTNLFKELLFVLIGFEVGTRFTRTVVVEMARLLPGMTAAVVALSAVVAALALGLALFVDLELSDLYLATTPGGLNAVLAAAEDMNANMPLITTVQSVRLLLMILLLPLIMRVLHRRSPQRTTSFRAAAARRSTAPPSDSGRRPGLSVTTAADDHEPLPRRAEAPKIRAN